MDLLLAITSLTVFTLMLTIGVNQSFEQLTSLWNRREVLIPSLVAVLVLVPAVVVLLLKLFDLSTEVAAGLALLAASPGAPLTTKKSQMAAADTGYVASLQLILALLAVVVTPCILAVFYILFDVSTEQVTPFDVGSQIARVTLLPVVIGLALQRLAPKLVTAIEKPLNVLANALFLMLVVALIASMAVIREMHAALLLDWTAFAAIAILSTAALAIGHALGGPRADQRAGLAIASLARNIGLALYIAGMSVEGAAIIPTLVAFLLIGTVVAIPYSIWIRRRIQS